jgi:hypothetical protein
VKGQICVISDRNQLRAAWWLGDRPISGQRGGKATPPRKLTDTAPGPRRIGKLRDRQTAEERLASNAT